MGISVKGGAVPGSFLTALLLTISKNVSRRRNQDGG
jgi:hypothetical protein